MKRKLVFRRFDAAVLLAACMTTSAAAFDNSAFVPDAWKVGECLFDSGPDGSFDAVSVKDPSIVYNSGKWHVFYTARSATEYTTGYVSASTLDGLADAERHELTQIRGQASRYACAPQVFYFAPQEKWYLLTQTRDANYQPVFSTTTTLDKPDSWTAPQSLIAKDESAKWIDFWVICDDDKAYLFYTSGHDNVMVRSTTLDNFPNGWGAARVAFPGVHEAVHVYKAKGRDEYSMIYELATDGRRQFGLARATDLSGPWEKVTDNWATHAQLEYASGEKRWTDMVSHGEAIRTGYDQRLEYDADHPVLLIQGLLDSEYEGAYENLPWKLGLLTTNSLEGDLNGDGSVGSADLDVVRAFWGQNVQPGDWLSGDATGDGMVDSGDLDIVRSQWGRTIASATTQVPEPTTFAGMVAILLAGLLGWR